MGTATGFNTGDTVRRQRPRPGQELGIFLRVDIVGDHRDLVSVAELLAQGIGEHWQRSEPALGSVTFLRLRPIANAVLIAVIHS